MQTLFCWTCFFKQRKWKKHGFSYLDLGGENPRKVHDSMDENTCWHFSEWVSLWASSKKWIVLIDAPLVTFKRCCKPCRWGMFWMHGLAWSIGCAARRMANARVPISAENYVSKEPLHPIFRISFFRSRSRRSFPASTIRLIRIQKIFIGGAWFDLL